MSGKYVRNPESQRAHDEAVRLIASERFGLDDWEVTVNPGDELNDCVGENGSSVYPDIVARHAEEIVALGEIETVESISEAEALEWKKLGGLCSRMYLFVPEGTQDTVVELIERHNVHCAGLRIYSLEDDNTLRVESVCMPNGRSHRSDHPWWMSLGRN